MLNNQKLRPYIIAFLAFSVLSSKHILIYNEETLVALSFLCFVIFVFYYFGDTIKESLNERGQAIQLELENFLELQESSLRESLQEHKKVSGLQSILLGLADFTKRELLAVSKGGEKKLAQLFSQQTEGKLRALSISRSTIQPKIQRNMAERVFQTVLVKFKQKSKGDSFTKKDKIVNSKTLQLLSSAV